MPAPGFDAWLTTPPAENDVHAPEMRHPFACRDCGGSGYVGRYDCMDCDGGGWDGPRPKCFCGDKVHHDDVVAMEDVAEGPGFFHPAHRDCAPAVGIVLFFYALRASVCRAEMAASAAGVRS